MILFFKKSLFLIHFLTMLLKLRFTSLYLERLIQYKQIDGEFKSPLLDIYI